MSKATHTGHCQCCGNSQKLPSGLLSQHGYTVEHGWFNGVCLGAGQLPYEQSKDLIESFINKAEARCDELRTSIKQWSEESVKVMRHTYYTSTARSLSGYKWEEVTLTLEESEPIESGYISRRFRWSDNGGDVVGIRYVAEHDFLGQKVYDHDVIGATIARSKIVEASK